MIKLTIVVNVDEINLYYYLNKIFILFYLLKQVDK